MIDGNDRRQGFHQNTYGWMLAVNAVDLPSIAGPVKSSGLAMVQLKSVSARETWAHTRPFQIGF
jgi:hypothetical protein